MMVKKRLLGLLCVVLLSCNAQAQIERHWNERFYSTVDYQKQSVWIGAGYGSSGTHTSNAMMNSFLNGETIGGEITEVSKDWKMGASSKLISNAGINLSYRSKNEGQFKWLVNAGAQESLLLSTSTDLLSLLLRGNAPFEDQTLALGETTGQYLSKQYLGVGTEVVLENTVFGASVQLEKISRFQNLFIGTNSNLYTAPYGTEISGNLELNYLNTSSDQAYLEAWYGTGVSASVYGSYQYDKLTLFGSLSNIGVLLFNGINSAIVVDSFLIDGYDVEDYKAFDASISDPNPYDLGAIVNLQDSNYKATEYAPAKLDLRIAYNISPKWKVSLQIQSFLRYNTLLITPSVLFNPIEKLGIEINSSILNFRTLSPGLNISFTATESIQLLLQTEQFTNLISPQESHSQALFVGANFRI